MRRTFNLAGAWIRKNVGFGTRRILDWFTKSHCTHKEPLFGEDLGLVDWAILIENEAGNAVIVNGVRYRTVITELSLPQLDSMDMEDTWFQYDSATCHTARKTELLQEKFPGHVISHNGDQKWHRGLAIWHRAISFFGGLWNLMSMPTNYKQFLSSRWRFDVSMAKLSRNYAEMSSRVSSKQQACASSRGGHLSDIVFHN